MSSIDDALNAAFNGPERKKLRIFDHEFNVKPLSISVSGGVTTAYGQISHCLAAVPDDQVYYDTTVQNRQVTGLQRRIENGGFSKIFAAVAPFVAAITHHAEFNSDEIKQAITAAEGFLNGSWQGVVDYMLSLFATQMAAEFSVGQMSAALTLQAGTVGTFAVYGDIRKKYDALDGERGFLGRPTTSETGTPDGIGRFNHFQHGSSTGRPPPAPTRCTAPSATNGPRWAGNAARSAIPVRRAGSRRRRPLQPVPARAHLLAPRPGCLGRLAGSAAGAGRRRRGQPPPNSRCRLPFPHRPPDTSSTAPLV